MSATYGSPLFTCIICGQENLSADSMSTHMLTVHDHIQCPMCDLAGISANELEFHINTAHVDIFSPSGSGHSSRTNGQVLRGNTSPVKQTGSVHAGVSQDHFDSKGKTLLELSKEHEVKRKIVNGRTTVNNEIRTKDATGRKIKNSRKTTVSTDDATENLAANNKVKDYIPQKPSSSYNHLEGGSTRSSSSSFSIISIQGNSGESGIGDDRSSISSIQSPLKKRARQSCGSTSDQESSSNQSNTSFNSIFSAIKNVIQSPFKSENTNREDCNSMSMQNLSLESSRHSNASKLSGYHSLENEGSKSKSVHELQHCPICEYRTTDVDALAYHVDEHFAIDTNDDEAVARQLSLADEVIKSDELIARKIENDERRKAQREEEAHFQELQKKYGMNDQGSYRKQAKQAYERALYKGEMTVSDYYNQIHSVNISMSCGIDDGRARTRGLVVKLYQYYCKGVDGVPSVRLCADQTSHYGSSPGDKGWGCGYKNIQILMTAMCNDPRFKKSVFNDSTNMPSISKIQHLIEKAWSEGYDPQGKEQLGGKLCNTRKWIGATEVVALFTSLKVRCKLIDFHKPAGPNRTHPQLFDWIKQYFGSSLALGSLFNKMAICSNKLPLYLQHEGHSRTIIGYEQLKDKSIRLLLFDPSLTQKQLGLLKAPNLTGYALKPLRQTLTNLKSKQYQIVCVEGNLTEDESKSMKIIKSERIP
ncbi:zinc finger-containing ubiquitin peptidase 1-like [Antedon mediterranea]|uniref:zinc finger-containing ubiquitin peptidase 1-like n=1 Tax=Antedon mediterranea TaxID=105859 RepID=UPI003AF9CC29